MSRQMTRRATSPHRLRPGSLQLVSNSGSAATPTRTRPPLEAMTSDEARTWLTSLRERLQKKMARERAYLDRRAARGTHTPTDDAYQEDQGLEADLLDMLEHCLQSL